MLPVQGSVFVTTSEIREILIPDALVVELYTDAWGSTLEYKGERYRLLGGARVNPGYISVTTLEMLHGTFFSSNDIKAGT